MNDKYKLVPVGPTEKMLNAGLGSSNAEMSEVVWIYEAMLAAAPDVQGEPVAWMHSDPGRVDVIHDKVRKLLKDSSDNAGYLHRPLDKSERYTIPLYAAPPPAEQRPTPDVSALVAIAREIVNLHAKRKVVLTVHVEALEDALADLHQPPTKCPGIGCTDQGCPAHYANDCPPMSEVAALVEAPEKARDAIASLPKDALGNVPDTQQCQGWHIRDELINDISTALAAYRKQGGEA